MKITERHFQRLTTDSTTWGENWRKQEGRFENHTEGSGIYDPPSYSWKIAYWLEGSTALVLADLFLTQEGHPFEVLWDKVPNPEPQWLIVTNYLALHWQKRVGTKVNGMLI
jgi:hypothetical protein